MCDFIVAITLLIGLCGWLATHQCVWLPACPVCLPEDDLCGPLPGLPQRRGVRCRLLWPSESCSTGTNSLSVWSSLIWVPLSRLCLVTVSVAQRIAPIVNRGLSLCVFLFVSHPFTIPCHEVDPPLLILYCFVFHTNTHRYHLFLGHNYSTKKTH